MNQGTIKVLASKKEAREKLFKGVKMLSDHVTTTLGPKGRNVAIQRPWGIPIVVHDGVTVAREVESKDSLVDIGIDLVKAAAIKTNEEAGDGTTTATLFAYELVKKGLAFIEEGINPMVLRNQVYAALPALLKELKQLSKPIKGTKDIEKVAHISSGDEEIGKLVADAVKKVGEDGLVTVSEGGVETEVEFTEGMEFDKGYISPYFITNPERMEAVVNNPAIVLCREDISVNEEIIPLIQGAARITKDIVIIAKTVKGDALATLVTNKMKGNFNALATVAPGVGDAKDDYLDDIAVLIGGKVLSREMDVNINKPEEWIGRAERVVSSRETTVIIRGHGDKKELEKRIKGIKKQIEDEKSEFQKERLEERLARLSKGIGVIRVGAKTEVDMREKVERVKDAVGAATSAREEGVVSGGGTIFLQISKVLEGDSEGEKLLKEVLEAPARKLMENSGETNDKINAYIKKILKTEPKEGWGYEVESGELCNLIERGIIDPAKVVRLALENAIAVACSILTTDALIAIKLEERNGGRK